MLQTRAWSQGQSFPLIEPFFPLLLYWKLVICINLETHAQGSASLDQLYCLLSLRRCIWNVVVSTRGMDKIGSRTNELYKQLSSNKHRPWLKHLLCHLVVKGHPGQLILSCSLAVPTAAECKKYIFFLWNVLYMLWDAINSHSIDKVTGINTKQQLNVPMVSSVVHLHTVFFTFVHLLPSRVCHSEFSAEHQVQVSLINLVFSVFGVFF